MGNCHPSKTTVNLGFASVDIGFLGMTISHVTLSYSQYLYNVIMFSMNVIYNEGDSSLFKRREIIIK